MNSATNYPNKPIRIIALSPPGGPGDTLGRIIGKHLTARWGQPAVLENTAGANAGLLLGARAAADGYTIIMGGGSYFINAALYKHLPFDSVNDFAPVSLVASIANVLVIHPSLPVHTMSELLAYAKAHPGELKYGSSGYGGPPHLAGELFKQLTGADIVHVPYKGHVAAGKALSVGKEIQLMFDAILTARSHLQSGELRGLAVTSLKRTPALPDIPTLAECGVVGYEINPDMGVIVPAGTPDDVISKISGEIASIMQLPEVKAQLQDAGMESLGTTAEQFGEYMKSAFTKWGDVVKNAGIEPRESPI